MAGLILGAFAGLDSLFFKVVSGRIFLVESYVFEGEGERASMRSEKGKE